MSRRFRAVVVALAASLAVAACQGGGPTAEAERQLVLNVGPSPGPLPSGAAVGCRDALSSGVRLGHRDGLLVILGADGDDGGRRIRWPYGFTAWLVDGKAEVRAPDGMVVAREGDVLSFGGGTGNDGAFGVCQPSWFAHMATPGPTGP